MTKPEGTAKAPKIQLFELGPTRSARVRWTLLEAGLPYDSVGNDIAVFKDPALKAIHPLGKLPAAIINDRPLFESAALITAIADLVPEKGLVAKSGTWERYLHYQWLAFCQTEIEAFLQSSEINTYDFVLPKEQHVPGIVAQNTMLFHKGAAALEAVLNESDFLVANRFSVTDIFVGYAINWGEEDGLLDSYPGLRAYLKRLYAREHCTLEQHATEVL